MDLQEILNKESINYEEIQFIMKNIEDVPDEHLVRLGLKPEQQVPIEEAHAEKKEEAPNPRKRRTLND